nr:reverse transcriptase domain-containing protein [Tanacetum cinerariifolium]
MVQLKICSGGIEDDTETTTTWWSEWCEDYDEEREMEPRPEPRRDATLTLRLRSYRVRRQRERVVGFEDASKKEGYMRGMNAEGIGPSEIETREDPGLHEEQRISGFVHGLRTRNLVEHLSMDLSSTYKGLMEKTYTWVEAREKDKDRFSPYRGPNHGFLLSLSKSPKEILATIRAARSFEPPPKMFGSKRSRDMSKYCHFHEDYEHDTNDCRHLKTQIQEAVNSGQLSHLVKGIKKERTKSSNTPRGESKKDKGKAPTETPILMVSQGAHIAKCLVQENKDYEGKEIIFPPVTRVNNAPVITEAKIFERKVGRVYMDGGSSFSLEITIGDSPLSRTETLNFVLVRSDSPHNMLLGRTVMQRMGIVVSTIHGAIKFHTEKGIETVLLTDEANEGTKRAKRIHATSPFLGHLITKHGIKANPSKLKAVTDLDQPRTLKDIQSLNEKLAALIRSLSKGTKRPLAFFKVLKGCKDKKSIKWTTKTDNALEKMKKLVQTLPTLTAPRVGETLTMHLAASKERRVAKWAIELGEHDIVFLRREEKETSADFLFEIASEDNEKKEKLNEVLNSSNKWRLYTNGASNLDGSGAGLMLIDPEGKEYTYALRFECETTNNEAEYEALLSEQESRCAKQAGINDLRTSHEGSTSRSFDQKNNETSFYWPSMHKEVAKVIQDSEKCKEESAIRKAGTSGAIANSEKETPCSLTYGLEAMIPIIKTTDDRGRVQKATKGKESKEVCFDRKGILPKQVAKIPQCKKQSPYIHRGGFVLLKRNMDEWQGPYIINEVYKEELYTIMDAADQSLVQTEKGTSLWNIKGK